MGGTQCKTEGGDLPLNSLVGLQDPCGYEDCLVPIHMSTHTRAHTHTSRMPHCACATALADELLLISLIFDSCLAVSRE